MWKKIGIIIICFVVVLSVLGLQGNFNYSGLKVAAGMVADEFSEVTDSFSKNSLFLFVTKNWTPNCTILVDSHDGYKLDSDGRETDERVYSIYVTMVYWNDTEDPEGGYLVDYTLTEYFDFADKGERDKSLWIAELYSQGKPDNWFETAWNGITFSFAEVLNFSYGVTNVVFDTGDALLSLGEALLYLIGF